MDGFNWTEAASELMGTVEDVLKTHLTGDHRYTQSFTEDVQAFVHAIDWKSDMWIFGLFLVELVDVLVILVNRRSWERLAAIFMANTAILSCAEWLNRLARNNWKSFSSQDYFDQAGVFASVLVGLPLLLCQFLIVGFLLREAACMVIRVKRLELKEARRKAKDE